MNALLQRLLVISIVSLTGCAGLPDDPGQRTVSAPSPNHNARRPNFVILHDTTSDRAEHALGTLTNPAREVSAHYLIGRDGTLYQLVDEQRRAWHAGASYWGGHADLNSTSIGIELDNTGTEPYAEAQIIRLLALLKDLSQRHKIPRHNYLGHGDVAPGRKVDPSAYFPWERLANEGYGLWCPTSSARSGELSGELPDPILALQAIGYDVADPVIALAAFRRHYLASVAGEGTITPTEQKLLFCLIQEKRIRTTSQ